MTPPAERRAEGRHWCPNEIAVIGAGASAVCLLDALAAAGAAPGGVTIVEPSPGLWRGRPFRRDLDAVRVNAPPEEMSISAADPGHFARWLGARNLPADAYSLHGGRYVPRETFGDYLEQSAQDAMVALIELGWRIRVVRDRVTAAVQRDGGLELCTAGGERLVADHTVLCVGAGPPADPYRLAGRPGVESEPYPLADTVRRIPRDAAVGVLGTGLTGVDVVLALVANGHRGPITMMSRSGVLPGVRQRAVDHEPQYFTARRLRAAVRAGRSFTLPGLVELMRTELAAAGQDIGTIMAELAALVAEDPIARLRRNLGEIDSPSRALRILQRAVPDTGPDVWPYLAETDQGQVLNTHYRALMSLCCPMPPASAAILLALADAGTLTVRSGVSAVQPAGERFAVTTATGVLRCDVMVNALNAERHKISPAAADLTTALVTAGVAERHPRGGLHLDPPTSRLVAHGRVHQGLYALGDLGAGSLLFTFGVPSLVDRAIDIVASIGDAPRSRTPALDHRLQSV